MMHDYTWYSIKQDARKMNITWTLTFYFHMTKFFKKNHNKIYPLLLQTSKTQHVYTMCLLSENKAVSKCLAPHGIQISRATIVTNNNITNSFLW